MVVPVTVRFSAVAVPVKLGVAVGAFAARSVVRFVISDCECVCDDAALLSS